MVSLLKLLHDGYLPKELPPCFSARKFAHVAAGASLPHHGNSQAKLAHHSIARTYQVRRELGVPNPAFQLEVARLIADNWPRLDAFYRKSSLSLSIPTVGNAHGSRALVPSLGTSTIAEQRAIARTAAKYVVRADVAGYYDSIYTHSIPWALEGKALAKSRTRDFQLLGNQLDRAVRNGQGQESIGLPIGPDTSYALAEVIGTAIDMELAQRLGSGLPGFSLCGFRFYDDFEISCKSEREAEKVRDILQGVLREFGLQLNARKTMIIPMPARLTLDWVEDIRRFAFSPCAVKSEIIEFFDLAFAHARNNPDWLVLPYAISRFRSTEFIFDDHAILYRLMIQAVISDASSIADFLRAAISLAQMVDWEIGPEIREMMAKAIDLVIQDSGNRGRGNEVAWALWGSMVFGTTVASSACEVLERMNDPFVAVLALDARRKKRLGREIDVTHWRSMLTGDQLYGQCWPLVYEALYHGFLRPGKADPISEDPFFSALRTKKVTFFEPVLLGVRVPDDYYDTSPDTVSL